jgi:hypothetical protein
MKARAPRGDGASMYSGIEVRVVWHVGGGPLDSRDAWKILEPDTTVAALQKQGDRILAALGPVESSIEF